MLRTSLLISLILTINAFTPPLPPPKSTQLMGFGDMFKGAFSNDDSLGEAKNAGLSGGPKYNEQVTVNGKSVKAVVGQKVGIAANAARVRIRYDCNNGDCGTCKITVNGRTVKACQTSIPSGKCAVVVPP